MSMLLICLNMNHSAAWVITVHICEIVGWLKLTVTTLSCPLMKAAKGINEFIISDYRKCHLCPGQRKWSLNLLAALTAWPKKMNSRSYQQFYTCVNVLKITSLGVFYNDICYYVKRAMPYLFVKMDLVPSHKKNFILLVLVLFPE